MQLKIIQIALGWRGEKYSLKVSDWMRSKLCDTVRHTHEREAFRHVRGFFLFFCVLCFGFRGLWQLHCFMSWFPWLEGNPFFFCFFFPCVSGHWHAARQYVASQCELSCPAGWQREEATHNTKLAAACESQPNVHLRHVRRLLSGRPPLHLYGTYSQNRTGRMRQHMTSWKFVSGKGNWVQCHTASTVIMI